MDSIEDQVIREIEDLIEEHGLEDQLFDMFGETTSSGDKNDLGKKGR